MMRFETEATKRHRSGFATMLASIIFAALIPCQPALAAPRFFGPIPYLSSSDIPAGFYEGGVPSALENFEDATLNFGITADGGTPCRQTDENTLCDSVDSDDGAIDGSGLAGDNWLVRSPSQLGNHVTFHFATPVTAAALVWTDGPANARVTFEAFGPGMVSQGVDGPFTLGDSVNNGTTADDRFWGVQDASGIVAIRVAQALDDFGGLEIDHVQFGNASFSQFNLELPPAIVSGINGIGGWKCPQFGEITIVVDDGAPLVAAGRLPRGDTAEACQNDGRNGFLAELNYSLSAPGTHTVRGLDSGVEFARKEFTVGGLDQEWRPFARGLSGDFDLLDFPEPGKKTLVRWSEAVQGFVIIRTEDR